MTRQISETTPLLVDETTPIGASGEPAIANDSTDVHADDSNGRRQAQFEGVKGSRGQMKVMVPAVSLGVFLAAADQTIIVSSYAKIGTDLKALNLTSFIATSYFLTLTSFQPLCGKLSDLFGRKTVILCGYAIFGLGSLLCGLAPSIYFLIGARALQGIGGGGLTTVVSIVFSDIVPLQERGMWQGVINIVYAVGAATGGPLGGVMSDYISWRFAFWVQAPVCALAMLPIIFVLKLPERENLGFKENIRRVDFAGAATLVVAVSGAVFGLDRGSNDSWTKPICYVPLTISFLFWIAFGLAESYIAAEPFAPRRIVVNPSLQASFLVNFFGIGSWLSVIFTLPLYFQAVQGMTATGAAARIIPGSIMTTVGSLFAGWYMKKTGRLYWLTVITAVCEVFGTTLMLLFSGIITIPENGVFLAFGLCFAAFGAGNLVTTSLIALISNADPADQAIVTACSYLFRSLGTVTGISISTSIIQETLRSKLKEALGSGEEAAAIERGVRQSLGFIRELDPTTQKLVLRIYGEAIRYAYVFMTGMAVCALVCAILIREKSLGKR